MSWKEYIKSGEIKKSWRDTFLEGISEGGFKLNVAKVPLDKARKYTEDILKNKYKKDINEVLPDFDKNYIALQTKCKKAKDVPRIEMPVIEPDDMKKFKERLGKGQIDIFKPIAKDAWKELKGVADEQFPKNLTKSNGKLWVSLGQKDGKNKDDVVKASIKKFSASELFPSQSQIWLEKLINNIGKWGAPKTGSPVLTTTIIVTLDKYILDGHHRFGQVILADPSLKMESLYVPVKFDLLLKVGASYGDAIGNQRKA